MIKESKVPLPIQIFSFGHTEVNHSYNATVKSSREPLKETSSIKKKMEVVWRANLRLTRCVTLLCVTFCVLFIVYHYLRRYSCVSLIACFILCIIYFVNIIMHAPCVIIIVYQSLRDHTCVVLLVWFLLCIISCLSIIMYGPYVINILYHSFSEHFCVPLFSRALKCIAPWMSIIVCHTSSLNNYCVLCIVWITL